MALPGRRLFVTLMHDVGRRRPVNPTQLIPHASSIGYALFTVINATQIWGGVFPFLPKDFQTDEVTLTFYLAQTIAFCTAFVASTFGSYYFPAQARKMLITLSTGMVFVGSSCVIAAMYVPVYTLAFVLAGGISTGVGTAGFFMLWQRYFSSIDAEASNYRLILGAAAACACYFALYLIPIALTAFLIPVVMLPICALCLSLSAREMDFDQPMFEDVPREHPQVYIQVIKDSKASALCVAALAFASGLARGAAVINPQISDVVNFASMAGLLLAAVILLMLWLTSSVRFGLRTVFRGVYPIVITGLFLFPFMQRIGLSLFAGLTYMAFSLVTLIMMMQCAQTSRDRGTNPVFVYGFFGSAAYIAQGVGFLLGWFANDIEVLGVGQTALLSIVAAYVLGMALFVSTSAKGLDAPKRIDRIEFLTPPLPLHKKTNTTETVGESGAEGADANLDAERVEAQANADGIRTEEEATEKKTATRKQEKAASAKPRSMRRFEGTGHVITDRLSKQCLVVREKHGLSSRETEVMELVARGKSMASIAEELFISENTVRTHCKHIYSKLDIHSRQELSDLVSSTQL